MAKEKTGQGVLSIKQPCILATRCSGHARFKLASHNMAQPERKAAVDFLSSGRQRAVYTRLRSKTISNVPI